MSASVDLASSPNSRTGSLARELLRPAFLDLGNDRVVDVILGLELDVGGAVLEVQLHDLAEQIVQLAGLAARAHEVERLLQVGVVDVLQN
jgi:hypothetical protein